PEPSSYALMLAGLALVGMNIRRKELSTHHHTPG
ncbi:MAG TPA: PEP-CTERM sorting domain-containing protein, partial [Nitrosospira sp.]|nr:PEP-CTERM sorting domain-containing protein [Nitrosospira sp.]